MKKTYCGIHQKRGLQFLILALFIVLIGSSTAAYGQFSDSFETAPDFGTFTRFTSPNSVTFTGGFTQTQGISSLYKSGIKSFMVNPGNTGTITFATPALSVSLWLRDRFSGNPSVLTVLDENDQVISTTNVTTTFVQVNIVPGCGRSVGSITLKSNGTGMAVIDDFSFTAGQVATTTVLVANFMNGNDDAVNSRVYLWNPSASAGFVCVRVFSLPTSDGTVQELTSAPLNLLAGKSPPTALYQLVQMRH